MRLASCVMGTWRCLINYIDVYGDTCRTDQPQNSSVHHCGVLGLFMIDEFLRHEYDVAIIRPKVVFDTVKR